jgi:predicted RND superfamily exporter protein
MRFRTWVIGVAALLTLMVVVAVIFVVTGNMNPPQKKSD